MPVAIKVAAAEVLLNSSHAEDTETVLENLERKKQMPCCAKS